MLAVDKEPGVRPLACGEIMMRLWGKSALAAEAKELARDACGNNQTCAGLQAGIEANVHAIRAVWPESGGWTFDRGTEANPTNIFQQLLDGTERLLASESVMTDNLTGPVLEMDPDEEDPGICEFTELSEYQSNVGFGCLLVDARNAFNLIGRYLMLWTVFHRWQKGSRFAFNRYRHHNIVYVRRHPGQPAYEILSKEGVAQGCTFGMFCYGVGLMPLCEQMRAEVEGAVQPAYADDISSAGPAAANAKTLGLLRRAGPKYGYFPETDKSHYICKGEDEVEARRCFEAEGILDLNYSRGERFLGSYVGCGTLKGDYVEGKVAFWTDAIGRLAQVAHRYPQSAYAAYNSCLQGEWQYLSRTTPDIAHHYEPLERAIRDELLPAFLGVTKEDITHEFRELLAVTVKQGGMGIRNPMAIAEESYHVSQDACSYLVETLVKREPMDQLIHISKVGKARRSYLKQRGQHEMQMNDRRVRGHPAKLRRRQKASMGTGDFLSALPHRLNGTILSAEEWRDNVRLLYNLEPLDMPQRCDGCMAKMDVEHALSCKKGGLVHARHDDVASEWRWLNRCAFSPGKVEREPYINTSVGRRLREIAAAAPQQNNTTTPATQQQQQQQQQQSPSTAEVDGKRGDAGVHGFWKPGCLCIFDIRITDTDARSYRHKHPKQVLETHEKEKKDKYLARCHELRKDFTPLVYSVDGMAGREARMAEKRLASGLADKWQRPYSQMANYVRRRMRIAIARSNSLLIRGSRDREPHRPFVTSGAALSGRQTLEEW